MDKSTTLAQLSPSAREFINRAILENPCRFLSDEFGYWNEGAIAGFTQKSKASENPAYCEGWEWGSNYKELRYARQVINQQAVS